MHLDVRALHTVSPPQALPVDLFAIEVAPMSQSTLQHILNEHQRYLTGYRGTRARLRSAKLDGLKLGNRDLREADLSGASLAGADLRGINLSRASLYCADLSGCDLRNARLDHADLRGASFKDANLAHTVMDHADLRAASMLYMGDAIRFHGNAHAESPYGAVDFSHACLRHASFRGAKLDNANFTDALLQGASFRGARLRNPCFRGAVLSDVDLAEINLSAKSLRQSLTNPGHSARERVKALYAMLKAHHTWFESGGRTGYPIHIENEDLRPLGDALKGLCLAGLQMRNVIAVDLDLSATGLQAARFEGCDLRGAKFHAADLSGTVFHNTKIGHADFRDALIRDLTLCSGQMMYFAADIDESPAKTAARFATARVQSSAFLAVCGQQHGSC